MATYTQPFVTRSYTFWHPDLRLLEYQCEENMEGAAEGVLKQ